MGTVALINAPVDYRRRQWVTLAAGVALLPALPGVGALAEVPELRLKPLAMVKCGPPTDVYLLWREGDQEIQCHVSLESIFVAVFHWQDEVLHRDGDLPALEIFNRLTGARRLTVFARQGIYQRDGGRPTCLLCDADGREDSVRGFDGKAVSVRKRW